MTAEAKIVQLLEEIAAQARMANGVIALKRDAEGAGRVKVAVAMHHIERLANEALGKARDA